MTTRLDLISTDRPESELADLKAAIVRLLAQQVERLRETQTVAAEDGHSPMPDVSRPRPATRDRRPPAVGAC
jgi:hypothetical protein